MRRFLKPFLCGFFILLGSQGEAQSLDARTQALSQRLRCPVCAGQSLWDSATPMARDIQRVIYEKLQAGQSEDQVVSFLHDRYGDAIYLAPPLDVRTAFLWGFPLGGALLALGFMVWRLRRRPV